MLADEYLLETGLKDVLNDPEALLQCDLLQVLDPTGFRVGVRPVEEDCVTERNQGMEGIIIEVTAGADEAKELRHRVKVIELDFTRDQVLVGLQGHAVIRVVLEGSLEHAL